MKQKAQIKRKHHFLSFGRDSGAIEVQVVEWDNGIPKLDLRRYVSTSKYTGATRSGVSLTAEEFATLLKLGDQILKKFVELWHECPWDGPVENNPERALRSEGE
jgi:hypothetical protein